jgi:hypothetical protein
MVLKVGGMRFVLLPRALLMSATWAWRRGKEPTARAETSVSAGIIGPRTTVPRRGSMERIMVWVCWCAGVLLVPEKASECVGASA